MTSVFLGAGRVALAAAAWRKAEIAIPAPRAVHLVVSALALIVMGALLNWVDSGANGRFQLYGINALVASQAGTLAVVALFAARRAVLVESLVLCNLFLIGCSSFLAVKLLGTWLQPSSETALPLVATVAAWVNIAWSAIYTIWLVGAIRRGLLSIEGPPARRPLLRAIGVIVGLVAVNVALPQWPLFAGEDFRRSTANLYEIASVLRAAKADPDGEQARAERAKAEQDRADVELAQSDLVQQSLAKLAPREAGASNLFTLGVAGWSDQDVFPREIKGGLAVLDARFGTAKRAISLINHTDTAYEAPFASLPNLVSVLRGVAERMDTERDALMLVLTSHGSAEGFALNFYPYVYRTLSPASLKSALDAAGIRNRIVIVSACHSGVFVPALADENTAVITAASAERTSFGCSNDREWTYFGDAFFNQALREGGTLPGAFARARDLIAGWEARDGLTASEPQIHVGSAIAALLPGLLGPSDHARAPTDMQDWALR